MKHRIKLLRFKNILGIDELEIEPGAVTLIEGRNGVGKTSFLAGVLALFGGGHDATLIRNGAKDAEVVGVLDDDDSVRLRITQKGSYREVTTADGAVRKSPQSWLNERTDALALNPVRFLEATPEEQARMLLEAMPVEVTAEEVLDAMGTAAGDFDPMAPGPIPGHGLDVIDRFRRRVYDERTGVNRLVREHEGTVKQLAAAVPEDSDPAAEEKIAADIAGCEGRLQVIEQARQQHRDQVHAEYEASVQKATAAAGESARKIVAEADERIEALKAEIRELAAKRDATVNDLQRGRDREVARLSDLRTQRIGEHDRELDGEAATLRERVAELRGHVQRAHDAARTRAALDQQRRKLAAAKAESEQLTAAIERLDALKGTLLERLPMKGLTVRDGQLYRGDIPFHRLNRAEQIKAAIRLAEIRAGEIPIVCADGLEALDPETFNAFVAEAKGRDVHLFLTRVTSDPELVIRKEGTHA